jgi:uncharacterized protein (TIRG00374 family)
MSDAPDVSCRKRPKAALVRDVLFVVGLAILATLSWQIGLPQILTYLQPLGWRFVLVFLAYLLVFVCDTLGWRYAFTRMPPLGFPRLLALQIVGKAANLMTPLLPVGGEPLKAYLLHVRGVPLAEGLASVVVARTLATVANGLFVLGVTGVIVVQLGLPVSLLEAMAAVLVLGGGLVGAFLVAQTRGLFAGLLGMVRRLKLRLSLPEEGARDLDRRLAGYYRGQRGRLALSLTWHLLAWLVEGVEVYVLLWLLELPRSPALAIGIVALASAIRAASFMIPASLGIQEGGNVFIFASVGLPPEAAMAFSLLRRMREWGWVAVGWLLVSWFGLAPRLPLAAATAGHEPGAVGCQR